METESDHLSNQQENKPVWTWMFSCYPPTQWSTMNRCRGRGPSGADQTTAGPAAARSTNSPNPLTLAARSLADHTMEQSDQGSKLLLVPIAFLVKWLCKLPEEVVRLSSCCAPTGRSKSSGGTDRAASWGSEEGHIWYVASKFGTRTSCRSRPWIWG